MARKEVSIKAIVLGVLLAALASGAPPDAAAQMKDHGGMSPKEHGGMGMTMQAAGTHKGTGIVNSIDLEKGTVNLSHEPIETLKWPKMTMDLEVVDKALLRDVEPGTKVDFELGKKKAGGYAITSIRRTK